MKIAVIAPCWFPVPPTGYGGTELVISLLTEELVRRGHDVTLFASGDSTTSAELRPVWPKALRLDGSVRDPCALHMMMLEQVRRQRHSHDLVAGWIGVFQTSHRCTLGFFQDTFISGSLSHLPGAN